jgi:hypothetical protein
VCVCVSVCACVCVCVCVKSGKENEAHATLPACFLDSRQGCFRGMRANWTGGLAKPECICED